MRPALVEFGRRVGMGRPVDRGFRPAAAGTTKARQPDRDRTEQGGDPAGPVILNVTRGFAGPVERPPGGMIAALRGGDLLLHTGEEPFALGLRQAQSGKIAQITRRWISRTSALCGGPSPSISTRRKIHLILHPQPVKHPAGHNLLSATPPNS